MRPIVLALGLSLAAAAGTAVAQPAAVDGLTITHVGTYTADANSAPARPGQQSPTGTVGTETGWNFTSDSTDIPGRLDTQFGIEFRLDGTPAGEGVTLHMVLVFPPEGIHNPNTGDRFTSVKIAYPNIKIGALSLLGYGFDNEWEIVPGLWIEQIWYQDRLLATRSFMVSEAE